MATAFSNFAYTGMRKLLFLLLFCPIVLQAQDSILVERVSPILKFSPLSLLDPLASIQFALEHPVREKLSLQHEVGYIIENIYENNDFKNPRGWRIRNEVRFYLGSKGRRLKGAYLAPEFLFVSVSHERNAFFGKNCNSTFDCDYYQYMDYTSRKQVFALHPKIGYQFSFNRINLDFYGGVGYRQVRVKDFNKPPFGQEEDEYFSFRKEPGIHHLPSLSLGFKLGFVLLKERQTYLIRREYN